MSDEPGSYEVRNATITPQGGGVYIVAHSRASGPETVRGKEKAEQRAGELDDALPALTDDQGRMEQQPPLDPAALADLTKAKPGEVAERDDEIASLKAQLAGETQRREQAEKAHAEATVRTVQPDDDGPAEVPLGGAIPHAVPRSFHGQMDDKDKANLKKLGVGTTDIVLEESESIPPTGLFLGHNGRGYVIKTGEPVTVPDFLINVLDDAIMSSPIVDGGSSKITGYRSRRKYAYRKV